MLTSKGWKRIYDTDELSKFAHRAHRISDEHAKFHIEKYGAEFKPLSPEN